MNSLMSLWAKWECPILNGVMFADGFVDCIPPYEQSRPPGTITLAGQGRTSLDSLGSLELTSVMPSCRAEDKAKDLVVIGGEGGMGSDGFVAVTDFANCLRWIAFFDFSNPFVSVALSGDEVLAKNNLDETWHFPLVSPSQIKVEVPARTRS